VARAGRAERAVSGQRAFEPALFRSPISLPEARSGRFTVRHVTIGGEQPVIGMRQAILRGRRPVFVELTQPLLVHELTEGDRGVWMSDRPEELNQIAEMLHDVRPRGRVLVGGLGLGCLAAALVQRRGTREVTVVEREPDVVRLCRAPGYRAVVAPIEDYLREHAVPFDFYLLDTWADTGEGTWWDEVMPLRRTIRNRFGKKPKIHCWAEDIMLGQVRRAAIGMSGRHWNYRALPTVADAAMIERFVRDVGLPSWETEFGSSVDAVLGETEVARKERAS